MGKKQGIVEGAFVLLISNFFVKILGAFFKIPLTNLLGASGIGTFSVAYNLYVVLFILSTAGLPVSISKMISAQNAKKEYGNVPKTIKCAFGIFLTLSTIISAIFIIFAKNICDLISNSSAHLSLIAISPAIILITITSILRGYYQGHHNMTKTAISQLLEAVFKLFVGYFFANHLILIGYSEEIASAGAIFGVTFGTLISTIYLVINIAFFRTKNTHKPTKSYKTLAKHLLKLSLPITITALILSLTSIVDMVTILTILPENNNEFYGAFNMATTVYSLPQTIISAIAISIIPSISEHFASKNHRKVECAINSGLMLVCVFSFVSSMGLVLLSHEILNFLYYKHPQDVLISSPPLVMLAYSVLFVSLTTITNSNLQAISKQNMPLKAIFLGIIIKFATNIIFIPYMSISGAAFGTILCFLVISIMNLYSLSKFYTIKFDKIFIKPAISSIITGFFIYYLKGLFDLARPINLILVIFLAIICYFLWLFIFGSLKDIEMELKNGKKPI